MLPICHPRGGPAHSQEGDLAKLVCSLQPQPSQPGDVALVRNSLSRFPSPICCRHNEVIKSASKLRPRHLDFPGGPVVKNPPANVGSMWRHGFDRWSRKIPHAERQLSLCVTTTESGAPWRSHCSEKPMQRNQRVAPACCN